MIGPIGEDYKYLKSSTHVRVPAKLNEKGQVSDHNDCNQQDEQRMVLERDPHKPTGAQLPHRLPRLTIRCEQAWLTQAKLAWFDGSQALVKELVSATRRPMVGLLTELATELLIVHRNSCIGIVLTTLARP